MYAKHRNGPGHMYRSNATGIGGVPAASRVSPEGSMRSSRMYNTDYNRDSYGRGGRPKQFQMPPPSQEVDIFMKAGKLAAEYLISKGILPPNALSGKWQNDGLKNQFGNFQGFRPHEVDKTQVPGNGRASAYSPLGNAVTEVGQGRRRYFDDYDSMGSRNSIRGRKRTGSFKDYGPEVNRELGRSGSWAEKSKASPVKEGDSDTSVGHRAQQGEGKEGNGRTQLSPPRVGAQEDDREANVESRMAKCNQADVAEANNCTLSNEKCLTSDTNGELIKISDAADKFDDEAVVEKIERNDNDLQQKLDTDEDVVTSMMEDTGVSEGHVDLVSCCRFVKVPTKARSLTKGSKVKLPKKEDDNISKRELSGVSEVHAMDGDVRNSGSGSSNQNHEFEYLQPDVLDATAPAMKTETVECLGPGYLSEISLHKEQKQEELSGFPTSDSSFSERGQKRVMDNDTDDRENTKKAKQWVDDVLPMDVQSGSSQPVSASMENQSTAEKPQSPHVTPSLHQESLDISFFPKGHGDPCEFMEEKQLFPGSFKTCDLNLVGSCDGNENHDAGSMLVFPSVTQTETVGTIIGADLVRSNNCSLPNRNGKHGINDNPIEIIDLDNDSALEHKAFSDPEKRGDVVFTDLDSFPSNVHNANGISDVHDGYGLMISELLANGSPNCSSVTTDLNSLHNHMGLPNTEGMLGDDDSIYMSLEEIPISILGPWEQPTQDYGKPF